MDFLSIFRDPFSRRSIRCRRQGSPQLAGDGWCCELEKKESVVVSRKAREQSEELGGAWGEDWVLGLALGRLCPFPSLPRPAVCPPLPSPFRPPPNSVPSPTCGLFGPDFCLQFQSEPSDFLAWRGPGPPALALPRGVTFEVDEGDLAVRAGGAT